MRRSSSAQAARCRGRATRRRLRIDPTALGAGPRSHFRVPARARAQSGRYEANGSVMVGVSGSCPKSELGVTAGAGVGAGTIGATGLGRAIGLFTTGGAAFFTAGFAAGFAAGPFLRATFFAFLATLLTFLTGRAFFFTALLFAAARFVLA
jgi:hypothetical protein